jgi:dTMP kinase
MSPGRLVAVSGVDGSGKSTLLAGLAAVLREQGIAVTQVAALKPQEPVPLGWLDELPAVRAQAELWITGYFALAFRHNLATVVEPALDRGDWVLADRWGLDHVANQIALGSDPGPWRPALDTARRPDAHFLVDVPAAVAAARIAHRGADPGIGSGTAFLGRCTALMREVATDPAFAPVMVLDGTRPTADVLTAVVQELRSGAAVDA